MIVYIGRWDLLPKDWEGYNGLIEKEEKDIKKEIQKESLYKDDLVGAYTQKQFEETFNQDLQDELNNITYWIRIF